MHNKLLPNLAASDTNIYYLSVSEGQESGSSVVGWYWLRVSCEIAIKLPARNAVSSEGSPGA